MFPLPPQKRTRLSPPKSAVLDNSSSDSEAEAITEADFSRVAAKWNLEQEYEQRPRKGNQARGNIRLPIKTREGVIKQAEPRISEDESVSGNSLDSLQEETEVPPQPAEDVRQKQPRLSARERFRQAQEEVARLATLINEDPEEHVGVLRKLVEFTSSDNSSVAKLGLLAQVPIYIDIIPSYRIRPLSEEELNGKLSKEVKKLRNFEQTVVGGYQKYVQELARVASLPKRTPSEDVTTLAGVAISCACKLLIAKPHFNFRGDLLKILVNKLSTKRLDGDFAKCCQCLEQLFAEDEEGNASLEAVAMVAKMIKVKNFRIDESVLNLFLSLRLLRELSQRSSDTAGKRINKTQPSAKNAKKQREFWTKKQRKLAKERKVIEKELKEADAVVSHEERDQRQAETLKLVFGVYFRILKERTPSLMGAVLEGLVKYAHLINQDFFGDLLEALKDLIREAELPTDIRGPEEDGAPTGEESTNDVSRNVTRESLLCVITAFALLQGQDGITATTTLNLDLNFFISHLYRTLYPTALNPDIEHSLRAMHASEPDAHQAAPPRARVNVQTTVVLLIRSLHAVLLPEKTRSVPPVRLAAFAKQILTSSLQMPEKSCTAMLGLVNQTLKAHQKKITSLWNTEERRGDGVFDALHGEVEGSNPFAATIWEGELLRLHYAPAVREGIKFLESIVSEK